MIETGSLKMMGYRAAQLCRSGGVREARSPTG